MKRCFDLGVALILLLLLMPVLLGTALLIRLFLGSPVLFQQIRPGLNGRPFTMIKFRTMSDSTGADGGPLSDEERMTRLGAFLRRASLDELPALWNVLRGDMSLVGPRPLLMEYLPLYDREQFRRHEVRPGITGWAQVNGRNAISWEKKFELDTWYVDHRTFALDLRILLMTLRKVFGGEGVTAEGHVTTEKFHGGRR